ncbi:MAG: hypothetical protein D6785_15665, partial [Planctomycetota bacterium]
MEKNSPQVFLLKDFALSIISILLIFFYPASYVRGEENLEWIKGNYKNFVGLPSVTLQIHWEISAMDFEEASLESPRSALGRLEKEWKNLPKSVGAWEKIKILTSLRKFSMQLRYTKKALIYNKKLIQILESAFEKTKDPKYAYFLGKAYKWERNFQKARDYFEISYSIDPNQPMLYRAALPSIREKNGKKILEIWNKRGNHFFQKRLKQNISEGQIIFEYI